MKNQTMLKPNQSDAGKLFALALVMFVAVGLAYTPYANAENISIGKQRPQNEEIKAKVSREAKAAEEKRKADLMMYKHMKENKEKLKENTKRSSLSESIMMQYKQLEDAKMWQKQLSKIQSKHLKENLQKQYDMAKLVNSGKVKLHTPDKTPAK